MTRLLLVLLVAFSLSAAEIQVSDLQYGPAEAHFVRQWPIVIGGGDGFLVVWSESLFIVHPAGDWGRAYDADGSPLSPGRIAIGSRHVVWAGESYLAVDAAELGRRGFPYHPVPTITVRRFRRDGTPAGPKLDYLEGRNGAQVLSIAWNGTHVAALVIKDHRRLLLFDAEGRLVGDTPVEGDVVAVAPNGDSWFFLRGAQPRLIAGDRGRYAIAGPESITIVDANGVEIDNVPIVTRWLSWDGDAWHAAYAEGEGRVCTAVFTSSADVRRNCRILAGARNPAVGAIPRRTLLAWEGPNSQILTDDGIASLTYARQVASAATLDATGLLAAWLEGGSIRLGGLRHDGTRHPQFFIPDVHAHQVQLAPNFIVWHSLDELLGMRLDDNGAPLHPILSLGRGTRARVVRYRDGWLVVRNDAGRIVATTISGRGVITSEEEVSTVGGDGFDVAAAGDRFLVVPGVELTRVACNDAACLVVTYRGAQLVDHDGRPLREPQPLQLTSPLAEVRAHGDGFRVYTTAEIVTVAGDGTVRGAVQWNDGPNAWGDVEIFRGRTIFFYTRDGIAYLRELTSRSRAVRH
ncbi:MAG TPA: hypothetical protein VEO54_00925 [Thermoanaerobaculia bacterium]|nr:hypothetical protein [Thermoanaerobaculia bacterium]